MAGGRDFDWPVLTEYDQDHLGRIALPLGGIGTGTVSLGGRGNLRDWEIMNRPAKGFVPPLNRRGSGPFFALYARAKGARPVVRCLEGPLSARTCSGRAGYLSGSGAGDRSSSSARWPAFLTSVRREAAEVLADLRRPQ